MCRFLCDSARSDTVPKESRKKPARGRRDSLIRRVANCATTPQRHYSPTENYRLRPLIFNPPAPSRVLEKLSPFTILFACAREFQVTCSCSRCSFVSARLRVPADEMTERAEKPSQGAATLKHRGRKTKACESPNH